MIYIDFNYDLADTFGQVYVEAEVNVDKIDTGYYESQFDIDTKKITVYNQNGDDITLEIKKNLTDYNILIDEAEIAALNEIEINN